MKVRNVCIVVLMLLTFSGFTQEKGKWRLGVDFGIAQPNGKMDCTAGAEIKYNLTQRSNVGLRMEGAGIARELDLGDGENWTSEARVNLAYLATYDYYFFQKNKFAAFAEGGIGYYKLADVSASDRTNGSTLSFNGKLGTMLKAGFELEKFRFSTGVHLISSRQFTYADVIQPLHSSYFTLSLGYFIGGGSR